MAGEWRVARIGEIAEKVGMGPFGSSIKVETFVADGIPVISGQHLNGSRLDKSGGFNFITPEHADKLKNANVRRGDVIFTHAGSIGQVAYVPPTSSYERYVISQRQFYLRCDTQQVIPEYVVAYFKSAEGQHKLLANTSQSGVPSIAQPVTYLRTIEIPIPPLAEQRAIAHILGTLDDKIELNSRMNETLEAMARAIFKSWFVDFDPVRSKAEGRQPFGMDADTAALFPDSFQDSPLGKIPKGWRAVPLPEAVHVNPPHRLAKGQDAAYLDMQNMPTRGHRPLGWIRRPFVSGSRFTNGDTLVARITPCLENGKSAYVDFLSDGEVAWGSTEFIVLRPRESLPPEYGYCLARDEEFRDFAIQNMTGSSGRQRVPTDCFAQYSVTVPPEPIAQRFGKAVRPLFGRVKSNSEEASTLAALRDTLLPKLISGEIRVKGAERLVSEVRP
jgi:type I restriction enzyme S subunit